MPSAVTAVLTIAGTDPSGRDGIQADLKTFAAHGCHGTSVVTAVTAQTANGTQRHVLPPDFVAQQITSTLEDVHVHAIKTGALFDPAITKSVASRLATHDRVPFVCDSLSISHDGSGEYVSTIVQELFPLAHVVTLSEAEALHLFEVRGRPSKITSLHDMLVTAQDLLALGPRTVFLKGGQVAVSLNEILSAKAPDGASPEIKSDFPLGDNIEILGIRNKLDTKDYVVDVLCRASSTESDTFTFTLYPRTDFKGENVRGADAALSAALACALGNKIPVEEAIAQALTFVRFGIETGSPLGEGSRSSSLNYLHSMSRLIVHPKTPRSPYPLTFKFIQNTATLWKQYVQHDFVVQLGKGTLDGRSFQHFVKQDYLYLKYYARAHALLASKLNDFKSINATAKIIIGISEETNSYALGSLDGEPLRGLMRKKNDVGTSFLSKWGMSLRDLEGTPESPATTAYGAFLIDTGLQGDAAALIMAVAACLLGYGEVGLWLKKEAQKPNSWVKWEGNPYLQWMEEYAGERYRATVVAGLENMERLAETDPPSQSRYDSWFSIWERTVRFEKAFWDTALNLA